MTEDIEEIKILGRELEDILNHKGVEEFTKDLIRKAIIFGYKVGTCEKGYEMSNDPYRSYSCLEEYEKISEFLKK